MTLEAINKGEREETRAVLLRCCGSEQWAEQILDRRPFQNTEAILAAAESVWWSLAARDCLQAFAAHPRIGAKKLSEWCAREQSGLDSTSERVLERLARGNEAYEERFGWIFLINASGKDGSEILRLMESRLANESDVELRIAAGEQAQIISIRLRRLLGL